MTDYLLLFCLLGGSLEYSAILSVTLAKFVSNLLNNMNFVKN